jgi:hypothetical protein
MKNQIKGHEICKTKVQMEFYFDNAWKHEIKQTRLWCKIIYLFGVEYIENIEILPLNLYPSGDFV